MPTQTTQTDPQALTTQQASEAIRAGRPTIRTAQGEVAVQAAPAVLEHRRQVDPKNPANAPRIRAPKARDPKVEQHRQELHALLALDPEHPDYDADRIHALHYLAEGQAVPGAADHPGLDPEDHETPAAE